MNPDVHSSHVGKVNSIRSAFLSFPMALCWPGRINRHNSRVTSELNWMRTAGGLLNGMKQGMRSFAFDYPTIHPPPVLKSETISLSKVPFIWSFSSYFCLPLIFLSIEIYFDETNDDPPLFRLLSFVPNLFGPVCCSTSYQQQSISSKAVQLN